MIRKSAKHVVQLLFGKYELYRIFVSPRNETFHAKARSVRFEPLDGNESKLLSSPDPEISALASYGGAGALGFAALVDDEIAAVAWVWLRDRYTRERGFITIGPDDGKLVQITTSARFRRRSIATDLIRYATSEMHTRHYQAVWARIWWSHRASVRAFRAAGWHQAGAIVKFQLPFRTDVKLSIGKELPPPP